MIERLIGDSDVLGAAYGFLAWSWPYVVTMLYIAIAAFASGHVVLYKRDVRAAVAWAGLIWLSPFLGAALYGLFGINRIKRRASRLRIEDESAREFFPQGELIPASSPSGSSPDGEPPDGLDGLRRFVSTVCGRDLTHGNAVTPLANGDEGYPAMIEVIEGAERSLALCTFIFEYDSAGEPFVEALAAAVARGVEVRVLIDGVGKHYSRPHIPEVLAARNVPVAEFLEHVIPLRSPYFNLRNHRKILVADGRVGFTGGLNIREMCVLASDPSHPTRDMHFRFEGPVVRHLMEDFALDWEFTTEEKLDGEPWFPELDGAGDVEARGIADGPDEDFESIRWVLLGALAAAKKSVRITTPYFLPDQTLIAALNLASMRGVRVEIVIPAEGNLRLVQWASTAQLWQVLVTGCKVFLSPPPFDHSKLMVVDDEWVFVGSANWDARSLRLNFEFNVECYGKELARRINELIDEKKSDARQIELDDLAARPLHIKLRDGIARLMAPYL